MIESKIELILAEEKINFQTQIVLYMKSPKTTQRLGAITPSGAFLEGNWRNWIGRAVGKYTNLYFLIQMIKQNSELIAMQLIGEFDLKPFDWK